MYVCMYVCMYVRRYVCMYVCMYVCIYVCMYACICIYIYTTARCRDSTTNPPPFQHPGLTLGFEVPRKQHVYVGRSLPFEFLRPFMQILREMISDFTNDEHHFCQGGFHCSLRSKPSNTYEGPSLPLDLTLGSHGDSSLLFHVHPN